MGLHISLGETTKCGYLSTTTSNRLPSPLVLTPPPLVRIIGEVRNGPQTIRAKTLYLRIRPCRYHRFTYICAILRPGRHFSDAHTHLYIGNVLYKFYLEDQNIICLSIYAISEQHFHYYSLSLHIVPQQ